MESRGQRVQSPSTGQIPEELNQLQNLFMLKLEYNNISGDVMSLANCLSLTVLNVSYNNLVGFIPTAKNFSRFPPESFVGNPGLCGYWLSSHCRAPRPSERVSISKAAILGIALGAMVILLMILFAACRPHHPKPFTVGPPVKLVNYSSPKVHGPRFTVFRIYNRL
ncbi:LRR receptor-like serine/threonine-protein kinase ERECTA isoform X1 [Salvia splendens]|uniref:LRR receptor-like serine/threonine-protein kinase ERECTA isoform X1 n=1 Tax=Salvia splendens TaxID=180675 RepID=UPI001C27D218|nr:LRR receptor-like serine/threonine-protein kinase ERECTA isoform X1 [Salvia splendens]